MKHLDQFLYTLLLAVTLVTFPAALNAKELINYSSNVFKFQQKLAENGNVLAQYKLALMYETGKGVEASSDKALHWYDRAAKSGLKIADQRSTYLMIKEHGFNKTVHTEWLEDVKADANNRQPEAMLLLGQLYRQGLGVTKNLNKSLDLLTKVSISGDADVESDIESIYAEIAASKQVATRNKPVKPAVITEKTVVKKKQKSATVTAKVSRQAIEKQKLAEKVRRYEKAMQQLKLEQQIIDQQQADVTDGAVASIDDEI